MADVTAPVFPLASVHTLTPAPVGEQLVGITISSEHDLDASADVVYTGFLLLRSADKLIQLSGELGRGSFASLARPTRAGVFEVVGRVNPVTVTSVRGGLASSFSLLFYDDENDVLKARDLFETGKVLEIRVCPEPLLAGAWIAILDVNESRLPYADWARKFDIQFLQTDKPS